MTSEAEWEEKLRKAYAVLDRYEQRIKVLEGELDQQKILEKAQTNGYVKVLKAKIQELETRLSNKETADTTDVVMAAQRIVDERINDWCARNMPKIDEYMELLAQQEKTVGSIETFETWLNEELKKEREKYVNEHLKPIIKAIRRTMEEVVVHNGDYGKNLPFKEYVNTQLSKVLKDVEGDWEKLLGEIYKQKQKRYTKEFCKPIIERIPDMSLVHLDLIEEAREKMERKQELMARQGGGPKMLTGEGHG